jgi:hypothetical protein
MRLAYDTELKDARNRLNRLHIELSKLLCNNDMKTYSIRKIELESIRSEISTLERMSIETEELKAHTVIIGITLGWGKEVINQIHECYDSTEVYAIVEKQSK